jgi:hypothetical protein
MQFELTRKYLDDLREAILLNNEETLLDLVTDLHAADIGEILTRIPPTDQTIQKNKNEEKRHYNGKNAEKT